MDELKCFLILLIAFIVKKLVYTNLKNNNTLTVQNFHSVKSLLSEAIHNSDNEQDKIEFTNTLELMNKVERTFNV